MQHLVSRMENLFSAVQAGAWLSWEAAESVGSVCLSWLLSDGLSGALHLLPAVPHPTLSCSPEPLNLPWLLWHCPHLVGCWGLMGCYEAQGCFTGSRIWVPPVELNLTLWTSSSASTTERRDCVGFSLHQPDVNTVSTKMDYVTFRVSCQNITFHLCSHNVSDRRCYLIFLRLVSVGVGRYWLS